MLGKSIIYYDPTNRRAQILYRRKYFLHTLKQLPINRLKVNETVKGVILLNVRQFPCSRNQARLQLDGLIFTYLSM